MWLTHYIQLGKLEGASSTNTTLTATDLSNIAQQVWEYLINADYEAGNVMTLMPHATAKIRAIEKMVKNNKDCLDEIKQMIKPILPFVQHNDRSQLRGGKNGI